MKPDFKTFCIIALAGLCSLLYFANQADSTFILRLADDLSQSQEFEARSSFRFAFKAIEELEAGQVGYAMHTLYQFADFNARDIARESANPGLASELESFRTMYPKFMEDQCEVDNYGACLSYGRWLVEQGSYDSAYDAFLKSAENGDLSAMSALVDLHRNSNWSNYSEEKATEWLNKIGK